MFESGDAMPRSFEVGWSLRFATSAATEFRVSAPYFCMARPHRMRKRPRHCLPSQPGTPIRFRRSLPCHQVADPAYQRTLARCARTARRAEPGVIEGLTKRGRGEWCETDVQFFSGRPTSEQSGLCCSAIFVVRRQPLTPTSETRNMTINASFKAQEWHQLLRSPMLASMAITAAGRVGRCAQAPTATARGSRHLSNRPWLGSRPGSHASSADTFVDRHLGPTRLVRQRLFPRPQISSALRFSRSRNRFLSSLVATVLTIGFGSATEGKTALLVVGSTAQSNRATPRLRNGSTITTRLRCATTMHLRIPPKI